MTIKSFADEISRFLAGTGGEVLCITGRWGVGKTFAWNKYLGEGCVSKSIGLKSYAYVSLFGQGSLDDIRQSIFENTLESSKAGSPADFESVKASLDTIRNKWRSAFNIGKYIPNVSEYTSIVGKLGFLSVKDQIICFDDLERASSGLRIRDILGLVSFLKEQRNCRVVILLNDERLDDQDGPEFRAQLEKVADTVLRFAPTPEEAATIGVEVANGFSERLKECCVNLGIGNIRTIKKIEKFCIRLSEELGGYDPRIMDQAVQSAALFGFSKFQPDSAPPLDYIRSFNRFEDILADAGVELPHQEWRDLLVGYGFGAVDELDVAILEGIDRGHFDIEALKSSAKILAQRWALQDHDASFTKAWDAYHGSFDDDMDEVLDGFESAIRTNAVAITPSNFSSTISILKELGRGGKADELIKAYISTRTDGRDFWDLEENTFGRESKIRTSAPHSAKS